MKKLFDLVAITLATDFLAVSLSGIYIYIYIFTCIWQLWEECPRAGWNPACVRHPLTPCLSFPHWRRKHQRVRNCSGEWTFLQKVYSLGHVLLRNVNMRIFFAFVKKQSFTRAFGILEPKIRPNAHSACCVLSPRGHQTIPTGSNPGVPDLQDGTPGDLRWS